MTRGAYMFSGRSFTTTPSSGAQGFKHNDHNASRQATAMPIAVALSVSHSLAPALDAEDAFWSGLSVGRADRALFLLAADGSLIRANDKARSLIDADNFLALSLGKLICADPREQCRFRTIIETCASGERQSGAMRLDGHLVVTIDSVRHHACARAAADQRILISAYPAEECRHGTQERWRDLFLLTRSEARVAEFMRRGMDDQTIADLLHLSVHTVRSYSKGVHLKTQTKSRAEVAHLLSRIDIF